MHVITLGNCVLLLFSTSNLTSLKTLVLNRNLFTRLPRVVCELKNLEKLELSYNEHLTSLDFRLLRTKLADINVRGCNSLHTPPYHECMKGMDAIRQHYDDISDGSERTLAVVTIAVYGQSKSGKTTLIRTLQNPSRERSSAEEELTKVFNIEEVELETENVLRFIDFGGNEAYPASYQLAPKRNCVPVIVVNMKEYEQCVTKVGEMEAVRQLVFDWMSHPYLTQPSLGPPFLVLTHRDSYKGSKEILFKKLRTSLLSTADALCNAFVSENILLAEDSCVKIQQLSNTEKSVFENIFEVGKEVEKTVCDDIKQSLSQACLQYVQPLPKFWKEVEEILNSCDGGYVTLETLAHHITDKPRLELVLEHMHTCGKILWYKEIEALRPYVFPKISKVTTLVSVIYDHDILRWRERIAGFSKVDDQTVNEDVQQNLAEQLETGVLSKLLWEHLVKTETVFQSSEDLTIALQIFKSFHLMSSQLSYNDEAIFILPPYYSTEEHDLSPKSGGEVTVQAGVVFKGLSPLHSAYQQIIVDLFRHIPSEIVSINVWRNGALASSEQFQIGLACDLKSKKVIIQVSSKVEVIDKSWQLLKEITTSTMQNVKGIWKGSSLVSMSYCSHCLLISDAQPDIINDPFTAPEKVKQEQTEMHRVVCGKDLNIPEPLTSPCKCSNHNAAIQNFKVFNLEKGSSQNFTNKLFSIEIDQGPLL